MASPVFTEFFRDTLVMRRQVQICGIAGGIWIWLWLVCVPTLADPPEATWPQVQLKKYSSRLELLPPERGSGSSQALTSLRLKLTMELSNGATGAFSGELDNFRLVCEENLEVRPQHRSEVIQLSAGQTAEVQLEWSLVPYPQGELNWRLEWGPDVQRAGPGASEPQEAIRLAGSMLLEDQFRRMQGLSVERVGPEGALALISSLRELDAVAVWEIDRILHQLSGAGVERVLFVGSESGRLGVTGEVSSWMLGLTPGAPKMVQRQQLPFKRGLPPFRFAALAEADVQGDSRPLGMRSSVKIYDSRETAISEALSAVYRLASVEQALADLESGNAGIRRAALEGSVDRLTEQQADVILRRVLTADAAQQKDYARLLNQLPGRRAVETLRELAMSEDREVAAAALAGIATSQDESALEAMSVIWESGESRPALQTQAVSAMVASDDGRWTPLVAAWVRKAVALTTEGQTAGFGREEFDAAVQSLLLRRHDATCLYLQSSISKVVLTEYQDVLLHQLVQTRNAADEAAVRPVVTARLRSGSISRGVLEAVGMLRAPEWGPLLLDSFWRTQDIRRGGDQVPLPVVLACSERPQLDELIQAWEKLKPDNQSELLAHLARYDHPDWRRLAALLLGEQPGAAAGGNSFQHTRVALQLLAEDAADESLQLLISSARSWEAGFAVDRAASPDNQRLMEQLLSQLAVFSHPECRRLLNQLSRSRVEWVRGQAEGLRRGARERSPAWRLIVESFRQREAGNQLDAVKALDVAVRIDPFLPDAWVRRASLRMHAGSFDESMSDLRRAAELTPDHEEVQSLTALVLVRQGRVDEGLAAAEELIRQTPNDLYSLYNGACTYARAAERPETSVERRTELLSRAVELLRLNNAAGHDEHEHMVTDPDLQILHQHPAWQELVDQARQNAEKRGNAGN